MTETTLHTRIYDRGISLTWLAKRLNVSITTVSRWLRGEILADADMIDRLCVATDGAISHRDIHQARIAWLRENRPEKFKVSPIAEQSA